MNLSNKKEPRLFPAIRIRTRIYKGQGDDSHDTLAEREGIPAAESAKGFTPDGKLFLDRGQAARWVLKFQPRIYGRIKGQLSNGLHSEMYAGAMGVTQQALRQDEPVAEEAYSVADKTALVIDKGPYLPLAVRLGERYKKVYYCLQDDKLYPESQLADIGKGFDEIERVKTPWEYIDKADTIYFPDCGNWKWIEALRKQGHTVFGSKDNFELDKVWFLEQLEEHGFAVAKPYYIADGVDAALAYLKSKGEMFLKGQYRGDFETVRYPGDMRLFLPWVNDLRQRLGKRADKVKIIIQPKIETVCEPGLDDFDIDGEFPETCILGYEVKDRGYIGKVFTERPEILGQFHEKLSHLFAGSRGHYSTEVRITGNGTPYYIDATKRAPSPPFEAMLEAYTNYPEAVDQIANGIVPALEHEKTHLAVLVLTSHWNEKHEIVVKVPEKAQRFVKLKNCYRDGEYSHCFPNQNGGFFGAVVGLGNSSQEAVDECKENFEQIEGMEIDSSPDVFEQDSEAIKAGEAYGIHF